VRYLYIFIHDLNCLFAEHFNINVDNPKAQIDMIRTYNWIIHQETDLNYHFFAEKVGEDYETFLGRPLNRLCYYKDIETPYDIRSIHVCAVGNFNVHRPPLRMYHQLVYRCIVPLIQIYRIPIDNVILHRHVQKDGITCPGNFFKEQQFKAILFNYNVR